MVRVKDTTIRNYLEMQSYADKTCEVCGGGFVVGDEIHMNSFRRTKKYYHLKHWEELLH